MSMARLPPGFRFHPTDVELIMYYLKRKIMGKKLLFDAITELNIYKFSPWDLPEKCCYKSKDLEWYFFCPRERKYASGARMNRATETGYWKTTGKDRSVKYDEKVVGSVKTLIFHQGHPPKGLRTDWVIHEYKFEDKSLVDAGFVQDAYVLCRVFQKSGPGPNNGAQYGAPFKEEDWEDEVVAEPCAADVFAAPPVTSVVHPVSPSVWATSEPSLCTIQPSNQKMPLDEQDEELLGEPNPSNLSSINWMPLDKLENEGDSPGGLNLSSIFYKQSTSMVDPGSGPSNEWPLDEQDEEMIGLLAHFTDDPSLVSASDKNNQIQNPANFNQDINAITPPFTDGNCILDSLGDIENWVGQGQFSANYCPDPAIQQDGAYLELNDLETPLYHFTETEQLVPDNFCISNVDMQKLCFESNSLGMHLDTCNNQLPMLPESYTQQVYNFPNNESQGFSAAANFSFGSYKQSDDSRLAAQSLERGVQQRKFVKAEVTLGIGGCTDDALSRYPCVFTCVSDLVKAEVTLGIGGYTDDALSAIPEYTCAFTYKSSIDKAEVTFGIGGCTNDALSAILITPCVITCLAVCFREDYEAFCLAFSLGFVCFFPSKILLLFSSLLRELVEFIFLWILLLAQLHVNSIITLYHFSFPCSP